MRQLGRLFLHGGIDEIFQRLGDVLVESRKEMEKEVLLENHGVSKYTVWKQCSGTL